MHLPRVIPGWDDALSIEVLPYLLPSERVVLVVRRHPASLIPVFGLLIAGLVALVLDTMGSIPGGAVYLLIPGPLFLVFGYISYRRTRAWHQGLFVLTSRRIILVGWRWKRPLIAIPVGEAADMTFIRTMQGRLLGYGTFQLRAFTGRRHSLRISHLPYPEQLYLEVSGLNFWNDEG